MKSTIIGMVFLLVGGVGMVCTAAEEKSATEPKHLGTVAVKREKLKTETKEAGRAMQDYAYAEKTRFVNEMKRELGNIQKELDRLSAKVERSSGAVKVDAKAKLKVVQDQSFQAKRQLEQSENATESSWDDMKSGFYKSYGMLKNSLNQTRQWLSKKIAL